MQSLRKHLCLNQMEMAKELGVNQSTISRWESGRCSATQRHLSALFELAKRKGVRGDDAIQLIMPRQREVASQLTASS